MAMSFFDGLSAFLFATRSSTDKQTATQQAQAREKAIHTQVHTFQDAEVQTARVTSAVRASLAEVALAGEPSLVGTVVHASFGRDTDRYYLAEVVSVDCSAGTVFLRWLDADGERTGQVSKRANLNTLKELVDWSAKNYRDAAKRAAELDGMSNGGGGSGGSGGGGAGDDDDDDTEIEDSGSMFMVDDTSGDY